MDNKSTHRINEIDLLRFVAAVSVVLFHYAFRGRAADHLSLIDYPPLIPYAKYGYLGVELFFMISGFVILMTAAAGNLRSFFISRVTRLYPAFWLACSLTYLFTLFLGGDYFSVTFFQYLANMTMLSGFFGIDSVDGAYWSLFVEIQFYLMVAFVIFLGKIEKAEEWLLGWLILCGLLELFPVWRIRAFFLVDHAAFFIGGALCYLIYIQGLSARKILLFVAAFMLAVINVLKVSDGFFAHYATHLDSLIIVLLVLSFFSLMLLIALRRTGFMAYRDWSKLGVLTYPLYLLHENIGFMTFNALFTHVQPVVLFWCVFIFMLFSSYYFALYVEKPLSTWMRRNFWVKR